VAAVLIVAGTAVLIARAGPERAGPGPTATSVGRTTPGPTRAALEPNAPALAAVAQATPTTRSAVTSTPPAATHTPRPTAAATARLTAAAPATPATPTPSPRATASTGNVVALTFDAGADRGYAEDILDVLRAERVLASFGITGQWAKANPDLVRRMAADGHLIVNHSLDHQSFTGTSDRRGGLSAAQRRAELEDADALIAPLIGHSTRPWYRLPYGDDDARTVADLAQAGFTRKVGWTIDTLGWRGVSATEIVDRSLRLAAPSAIYVLHVGHTSQDGPALVRIVAGLREHAYGFVTVDALSH
jgi:peptidoglycan/xylan/chitin deacetylase (PgdA/CDA1 family)